jgi:uncharacterized protein (DUF1778 family)
MTKRFKQKMRHATLVSQQKPTDFVLTSLLRTSDEALKHNQTIMLTNRDSNLFLAALEAAEPPRPVLRKAAQRFKRRARAIP